MARCVVWRAAQGRPRRPETRHAGQAPKPPGARTRPLGQELAQRRGARGLCFGIPLRAATQVFCNAFSGDLICPCRWIYLLWRSAAVNQAVKRHVLLSTSALGGAAGLARLSRSGSRRAGLCGRRRSWLAQRVCCRRRCSKSSDPALDPVPLAAARWLTRVLAAPPTGRPRESAPVERKARARVAG